MRGFCKRSAFLLILGLFIGLPFSSISAQEQESCGNIIYSEEESYPIENCDSPFGVVTPSENLKVTFGETVIEEGGVYPLVGAEGAFQLTGTHPEAVNVESRLYKKEGNDFRVMAYNPSSYRFTEAGVYVMVVFEEEAVFPVYNPFKRLFDLLIPTAYAFPGTSRVITFQVVEEAEETNRISNILFLPGIQSSRLYTKDEDGDEEKLWEPGGDDDVARLAMTETGESVEDIYAKEVVDEVTLSGNVYKGFLEFLSERGADGNRPIVGTFPYDWREDVFDVVEQGIRKNNGSYNDTVEAIEYLATTSSTGKVTLIGHSNGGLLAKAIMRKLADEGRTDLVDKVIFIAVPHIGTPKGIMALLHGYDQGHALGLVSTSKGVRKAMKNMPGVYGLLPSGKYLSSLSEPLISFDDSVLVADYKNAYGFTITNVDEYRRFLNGSEGRVYADNQVNEPSTANSSMLEKALQKHSDALDNWEAPPGVEVFNIVGTGLPTPNSIEYKGFEDVVCAGSVCKQIKKIEPVIHFTNYGDETVVSKSAKDTGVNNLYFNILRANAGIRNSNHEHVDITETETIQLLVDHILHGSSTDAITYVSNTEPILNNNTSIVTIHSPARIFVQDSEGKITGRTEIDGAWQSEIPGSDYFEAGEVKYVLVPSEGTYSIIIEGEGTGVYTHEVKRLRGDSEESQYHFTATVTPTMVAKYTRKGGVASNISVDANGDGRVDMVMTQEGVVIPKSATYDDLYNALGTLSSTTTQKKFLVGLAHQAEKYSQNKSVRLYRLAERVTLLLIKVKIEAFQKTGVLSGEKKEEINEIINNLLNKK